MSDTSVDVGIETQSPLSRYYPGFEEAASLLQQLHPIAPDRMFSPPFEPPARFEGIDELFAPAKMRMSEVATYKGHRLHLLNLMRDPTTNTTKSFASLMMVARAVSHIRSTGEAILFMVPTSCNKGTGLRSAVERALSLGLVPKDKLRIGMIVPAGSQAKLRRSSLTSDPDLRALNPIFVYSGSPAEQVKSIGRAFVDRYEQEIYDQLGLRIWYSLNLANYRIPDSARAFFEHETLLASGEPRDRRRWHVHAVSSAFGLLGHRLGMEVLDRQGLLEKGAPQSGYFLVQHLGTPDMVLHWAFGSFDHGRKPSWSWNESTGLHEQSADARFPYETYATDEILDSTFYSRKPGTCTEMTPLIQRQGGGGIVVSLKECLDRYPLIRSWLSHEIEDFPADPRQVSEWSLIMAFTGILNAIDRGLVEDDIDLVIHGSGFSGAHDNPEFSSGELIPITDDGPIEAIRNGLV